MAASSLAPCIDFPFRAMVTSLTVRQALKLGGFVDNARQE